MVCWIPNVYKSRIKRSYSSDFPIESRVSEKRVDELISVKKRFKISSVMLAEKIGCKKHTISNIFQKRRYCYTWEYERILSAMKDIVAEMQDMTVEEVMKRKKPQRK